MSFFRPIKTEVGFMHRGSITETMERKTTELIHKVTTINQSLSTTEFIMHKVVAIVVIVRQMLVTTGTSTYSA